MAILVFILSEEANNSIPQRSVFFSCKLNISLEKYGMSHSTQRTELIDQKSQKITNILNRFTNTTIPATLYKVKGEDMIRFSKSIGCTDPTYTKIPTDSEGNPVYDRLKAHPMFPSIFTIKLLFKLQHMQDKKTGKPIAADKKKFLHAQHRFNYENTVPIKAGQLLSTKGELKELFVKNKQLWFKVELETRTLAKELVIRTYVTFIIREGGFNL